MEFVNHNAAPSLSQVLCGDDSNSDISSDELINVRDGGMIQNGIDNDIDDIIGDYGNEEEESKCLGAEAYLGPSDFSTHS